MPKNRPVTVVLDTSVMLHQLHAKLTQADALNPADKYSSVVQAQLAYVASLEWLGELKTEDTQLIWACDQKDSHLRYWRHSYLERPEVVADIPKKKKAEEALRLKLKEELAKPFLKQDVIFINDALEKLKISYKAGRAFPEYTFTRLKKDVMALVDSMGWRSLRVTGYEADDVAAAIVRVNQSLPAKNQHDIILATVDSDWMGLISERVWWYCLFGYQPRLRYDLRTINSWCERRLGVAVETPREIWKIKQQQGDKSDNLPSGTPIEVIDLLSTPYEFCLWEKPEVYRQIYDWLQCPQKDYIDPEKLGHAKKWLQLNGVPLTINPFDKTRDLHTPSVEVA